MYLKQKANQFAIILALPADRFVCSVLLVCAKERREVRGAKQFGPGNRQHLQQIS
jgi:hypothetical protein